MVRVYLRRRPRTDRPFKATGALPQGPGRRGGAGIARGCEPCGATGSPARSGTRLPQVGGESRGRPSSLGARGRCGQRGLCLKEAGREGSSGFFGCLDGYP